jgi:hypothetical protein
MDQGPQKKPRKRLSPDERMSRQSFEARVSQRARELEEQAWRMPPGPERDQLLRRARQLDIVTHIDDWLSLQPGSRPPD